MDIKHSQQAILDRIEAVRVDDFFGTEVVELVSALGYHAAKRLLVADTVEGWAARGYPQSSERILKNATEYLAFAVEKATNHRGLSAARSVAHYRGWVWLLAPDLLAAFEAAPYEQYGMPKIKAAALALGLDAEWADLVQPDSDADRMSNGLPCEDGCYEGCGS